MQLGGSDLTAFAQAGTPAFVDDAARVRDNLLRLRAALAAAGVTHDAFYAIKTNRFPPLIGYLKALGSAASSPARRNLAAVRAGEYEGLERNLADPEWRPGFGPATHNPCFGAYIIGARECLIAYNVRINLKSIKDADYVERTGIEIASLVDDSRKIAGLVEHEVTRVISQD